MRVIAGRFRGRRLKSPPPSVRPTTDRLRESLFNYLGETVKGAVWVDLFGGSGAVSIEALSRGAKLAVICERDPAALRLIRDNLRRCGIGSGFELHPADAFRFLLRPPPGPADFVFLDPPYQFERYGKLLQKIALSPIFHPKCTVLLEIFKKTPRDFLQGWHVKRTLTAGDSHLLVLEREM